MILFSANLKPALSTFLPSDIAGLKLWLKADSLVLTDNDPVTTWADQSGNGNDATQATAAKKPLYKTNIQNGKPVVRFVSDDHLDTAVSVSSLISNNAFTIFVIVIPSVIDAISVAGAKYENDAILTSTAGAYFGISLMTTNPSVSYRVDSYNYDGTVDETGMAITLSPHLIETRHDSGTLYLSLDAGAETSVASGNTQALTDKLRLV